MSIPTEVMKLLKCSLADDDHIVQNAVLLTACGGNACQRCIQNSTKYSLVCNYCKQTHYIDQLKRMPNNKSIDILIKSTFFNQLVDMMKSSFNEITECIQINQMEDTLNNKIDIIENDILIRIESLKMQLDHLHENFRRELSSLKNKISTLINDDEMSRLRESVNTTNSLEITQDNFFDIQKKLKEFEASLKRLTQQTIIRFDTQTSDINESLIGKLDHQFPILFQDTIPNVFYPTKIQHNFLYTNQLQANVTSRFKVPTNMRIFKQVELETTFSKKPTLEALQVSAVYLSANSELFIGDSFLNKISVFDINLNLKREFANSLVKEPSFMTMNEISRLNHLFVSDTNNNCVTIWDSFDGTFINEISIDSPKHIKFAMDKMFITSHTEYEKSADNSRMQKIIKGSNCVFMLNANTFEIVQKIELNEWLSPIGLHFDKNNNLQTTALMRSCNETVSRSRFLTVFDSTFNLRTKIELKDVTDVKDFFAIENKIFFFGHNSVNMFEFE